MLWSKVTRRGQHWPDSTSSYHRMICCCIQAPPTPTQHHTHHQGSARYTLVSMQMWEREKRGSLQIDWNIKSWETARGKKRVNPGREQRGSFRKLFWDSRSRMCIKETVMSRSSLTFATLGKGTAKQNLLSMWVRKHAIRKLPLCWRKKPRLECDQQREQ